MDALRQAISIKAAVDGQWGPRDADGRRRALTVEELDELAAIYWHWPDLQGAIAACANTMRSRWASHARSSDVPPRVPSSPAPSM
jgi:hypothetical protein